MQRYNGQLINQFPNTINGNAAAGVQVTIRVKSSGTLATLYATNSVGGGTLPNPLTTDAKGYYGFYAADGVYTLDVNISGTPQLEIQLQDVADLQAQFDAALANAGYIPVGTFAAGCTVSQSNGAVSDGSSFWRWDGALPKTVTAGSEPTPTGAGNWILISDGAFRASLASATSTELVADVEAFALVGQLKSLGATEFFDLSPTIDAATSVNLAVKPLKTYCTGVAESSSLSADYNYTKLNGEGGISTIAANNRAWLASLTGSNWVQLLTPFGVIVGDSIAEGHPNAHGRLHQSYVDPTFNDAILNVYGTPSYALSQRTGMHWYNAGIGGQTTAEILARFDRDALGQTVVVGDGRPNTTLPAKPVWIWVNAGINDVSALTATSVTKTNLLKMAIKALNAGVNIGFNTIGPVDAHNSTQRGMQDDINNFILTVLPLYGCHTFDFHSWFVDPSDATKTNPRFSADGVHPNKTGYNNYVARLLSDCNLPIYLNGLAVESYGETYSSNYRAPTTIEFEDNAGLSGQFGMSNQFGVFNPSLNLLTSALLKVYVRNGVDGINGARHSGFSNIHPIIGYRSQKQEPSAGVEKALGGHIVKVSGTWQATTTTQALGVSSVSATSTGVWVTFTVGVNRPMVSMTGSSTPAIYAATPQGAGNTQVRVRVFDRSTGAEIDPTTMPDNTGFNILAFGVV